MAIEAFSSSDLLNFVVYDTVSATTINTNHDPLKENMSSNNKDNADENRVIDGESENKATKKRKRKQRICKSTEEAYTQRMTHIAVERNRRKQMNEHLAVLKSLMPQSYVQRGDQASIVGGAIEYLKELEQLLQYLEVQKLSSQQNMEGVGFDKNGDICLDQSKPPPFSGFFSYPQYVWSQTPKRLSSTEAAMADIEVTLIESHANIRILSRKTPRQISKLVSGFDSLLLSILHLSVTTMNSLVLYSISAKVEENCKFNSVDDIAGAVNHMLRLIEEEDTYV